MEMMYREDEEERLEGLKARLAYIEADPERWAVEQVARIERALSGQDDGAGAVVSRKVKVVGNESMYEHLQRLKAAYQVTRKGDGQVAQEVALLRQEIQHAEAELCLSK